MLIIDFVLDAVASALGSALGWRRRGRVPREPWAQRRSRRRMEGWRDDG